LRRLASITCQVRQFRIISARIAKDDDEIDYFYNRTSMKLLWSPLNSIPDFRPGKRGDQTTGSGEELIAFLTGIAVMLANDDPRLAHPFCARSSR